MAAPRRARSSRRPPVVGFLRVGSPNSSTRYVAAFRKGLSETGTIEDQNVTVEYHWLEGQLDSLPAVMADLVHRQVAVIASVGDPPALAAKAATTTIPIVFGVGRDPVQLGLVASLARPGGNATGINFFAQEVVAKRLRLLHDLVPKAVRIAVFVNPASAAVSSPHCGMWSKPLPPSGCNSKLSTLRRSARSMRRLPTLCASAPMPSSSAGDAFFTSRFGQFATFIGAPRDTSDVFES